MYEALKFVILLTFEESVNLEYIEVKQSVVVCNKALGNHDVRSKSQKRMATYGQFSSEIDNEQKNLSCKDYLLQLPIGSSKQRTSNIAQKAADEAKAAYDAQATAGQQASHQVKAQLAEKALQAARTVEVVLGGKQSIVEHFEQEVRDAEAVVKEEAISLEQARTNTNYAVKASQQATALLKSLSNDVHLAEGVVENSNQAYQGAQQEFAEKTELFEAAKNRLKQLLNQLALARVDFTETKRATNIASAAAREAKVNAARNKRMSAAENNV